MTVFAGACHCKKKFEFVVPAAETQGYLECPVCRRIVTRVSVDPWVSWIQSNVKKKRQALYDRSNANVDPVAVSMDGMAAELAACLVFCPGFLDMWLRSADALEGRNVGKDLLGSWIGCAQDFEIKWTERANDDVGILYIRKPADEEYLVQEQDVKDSIYTLFTGKKWTYTGACWTDKRLFLGRGERDPKPLPKGYPTWGGHWGNFNRYGTIVEQLHLSPAKIQTVN